MPVVGKVTKKKSGSSTAKALAERIKRKAEEQKAAYQSQESQKTPETAVETVEVDADAPQKFDRFAELELVPELLELIEGMKFTTPTPIQAELIPQALAGKDIIGLAVTGSGKTAAFAIPILQALAMEKLPFFALVLAPTRELAYQIKDTFDALGRLMGMRSVCIVGGMNMMEQALELLKKPHVIVATPGRIMDHLELTKGFNLRKLRYLVMDEADRLLDMDFGPALDKILKVIPRERHTYLFSATMTNKIEKLQRASLRDPVRVAVLSKYETAENLQQLMMLVSDGFKNTYLVHLLNEHIGKLTIIFCRTVVHAQRTALMLTILGFHACPLHGQLTQTQRLGSLNKFKAGKANILLATDVAARGLDIPSVDLVINYDIPTDSKAYIHRVGRTARAGRLGKSVSLVTQYDLEMYLRIEAVLQKKLPKDPAPPRAVLEPLHIHVDKALVEAIRQTKEFSELKLRGRRRRDDHDKEEQ